MSSKMKLAIVTPLFKKSTLESDELKNYRPVSNLSFVSKLTEEVVAARLIVHLQRNNLQEPLQSAYKQYCSSETFWKTVPVSFRKGYVLMNFICGHY